MEIPIANPPLLYLGQETGIADPSLWYLGHKSRAYFSPKARGMAPSLPDFGTVTLSMAPT
ncbi:hypothetical protein GCM10025886_00590 [Tetragenococcus halophilus subsp. flandriensis]|nr:hypothetical protein GCM10025886_00590 [Tetragenococcus halophilus subsp. flandriensis]